MGAACCQCQQVAFEDDSLQFAVISSISSASSSSTTALVEASSLASIQTRHHQLASARIRHRRVQRRSQHPTATMSDHHSLTHYFSLPFSFGGKGKHKDEVQLEYDTHHIKNENKKIKTQLQTHKQLPPLMLIGDHWHQENGVMAPLSLVELCIRHLCSQLAQKETRIQRIDHIQPIRFPSELASWMIQWLQQHDCLEKPQFQYLSNYLYHDWSINNHSGADATWLDAIPSSSTCNLTRFHLTNCYNLRTLGSSGLTLPQATTLSLEGCTHLQCEVLPDVLPRCIRLVSLNLSGCRNVNDSSLMGLSGLVLLKCLDLSGCPLITDLGFQSLLNLERMEILKLNRCLGLSDDAFEDIKTAFPVLSHLELARCRITDVTLQHLEKVVNLHTLVIRGCRQVGDFGIERLYRLTALQYLHARYCPQLCGLRREWVQLRVLLLTSTAFHEMDALAFTSMPHLEVLDLRSCRVVKRGFQLISQLKSLKRLILSETALTDTAFLQICQGEAGRSLVALDISHTEVTDVGTEGLQLIRELECLSMDTPGITNRTLSYVSKLKKLQRLDLFGSSVSDNGMLYLTLLPQLKALELCGGTLTCRGVSIISRIKSLELLNLSQNRNIGVDALDSLGQLTRLKHLNLSDTGIKTIPARHLRGLKDLESLSVYGCEISASELEILQVTLPKLSCLRCT